jgi:hypothetical protein
MLNAPIAASRSYLLAVVAIVIDRVLLQADLLSEPLCSQASVKSSVSLVPYDEPSCTFSLPFSSILVSFVG